MGHRHQRYIVMGQVLVGTIEMIGQERAPLATFRPACTEHEVIDQ